MSEKRGTSVGGEIVAEIRPPSVANSNHMNQSKSLHNQVRIISGKWRSRTISFANLPQLRPSPNRVRETLFNWLPHLEGMICLDLFAGSGALGLEALSRGAKQVVAVDCQACVVEQLHANATKLEAGPAYQVHRTTAEQFLLQTNLFFDLVFLDPPFHSFDLGRIWHLLELRLALSAWVYLERGNALEISKLPSTLTTWRAGKAGKVYYFLLRYNPSAGEKHAIALT